jgi:hypothetical protein
LIWHTACRDGIEAPNEPVADTVRGEGRISVNVNVNVRANLNVTVKVNVRDKGKGQGQGQGQGQGGVACGWIAFFLSQQTGDRLAEPYR